MGRCSDARDRLLATAGKLLHERGYTAVSVSDICTAAGLKKGSFYHFFESKQALALATIEGYAEQNRARMRTLMAGQGSVRDKLRVMFTAMHEAYRAHHREGDGQLLGCPLGNLAGEMAGRDREITDKLASIFGEWRDGLQKLLEQGATNGEFVVSDVEDAAEALVAYVEGAALLARTMSDPEVVRRMGDRALSLLGPPAAADTAAAS